MSYFVRFNNDNIWEIIGNDRSVTCYKRNFGKFNTRIEAADMDENTMVPKSDMGKKFSYEDWKTFFGDNKLKNLGADPNNEQYVLPLIYFCKYVLGFNDDSMMERQSPTRYVFEK
jgi:hypothetical protein